MKKVKQDNSLKEAIGMLENKQSLQLKLLKDQLHITYQMVQPVNLIRNTLYEAVTSPEIRNDILLGVVKITTGYLFKKLQLFNRSKG